MTHVWAVSLIRATGSDLLAVAESKDEALRLIGLKVGRVIGDRDAFNTERGFKVRAGVDIYTIREVPVGEWL